MRKSDIMDQHKTPQTYDLCNNKGTYTYGRFFSISDAREKARVITGENTPSAIYKNPKLLPNGELRPRFKFIECKTIMFIRPTYDFKMFCKEAILKNDMPTGKYKYYRVAKDGTVADSSPSYSRYFDPNFVSSGVWVRPKKRDY